MSNAIFSTPVAVNEPIRGYLEGTREKSQLKHAIEHLSRVVQSDVPIIIGGQEMRTQDTVEIRIPHNHQQVIGRFHRGTAEHVHMAIEAAAKAKPAWAALPWQERAAVFLKAADLLRDSWRATLNAATMLTQSKTAFQSEIDAACELIDFFNFNAAYMRDLYTEQPQSGPGMWNRVSYRPLEGFVFAVTPFNFTSIAANLPCAPAMMGNTVLWKPASTAVLSAHIIMRILKEAGLPDGVINMVPGKGSEIGPVALAHRDLAGVHFTGSTPVFQGMWRTIGENIANYRSYPRIVGETGGKDFLIAHADCDLPSLTTAVIRGAFEYQGQKCSALSRFYVARSLWDAFWPRAKAEIDALKVGDIEDFQTFMGAVIDRSSFETLRDAIEYAKNADDARIISGGGCDDSVGYFIEPTVILTTNPKFKTMEQELFGPVLTIYIYEDDKLDETLKVLDETSIYALTGAIFAKDRAIIHKMTGALENAAGNFYINDKPTGAVVGQQPFGGGRGSGTNDKAGSKLNLIRWTSVRTLKETFDASTQVAYPYMDYQ